jgi:NTE family protein
VIDLSFIRGVNTAMRQSRAARVPGKTRNREPLAPCWKGNSGELKSINLALQGGGAHGAFTWGVLNRLLEDDRIAFDGISASSAGAMNAVVLAFGLAAGGRNGAKRALSGFWRRIAHAASLGPLQPTLFDRMAGNHSFESSPSYLAFDMLTRLFSPYELNPFNHNPLRDILAQVVDFEAVRKARCPIKLYLSATNVRTGKVRIFDNDEVSIDSVLASACLPFLFQAVEIDGEHYWDGGYMGNPAIFPLIYGCDSRDIVIVHINPIERAQLPKTAAEILNRVNEISFNSSLMREMRAIAFVTRLIDDGRISGGEMKRMFIHGIEADDVMREMSAATKLDADWDRLNALKDVGRRHAGMWLDASFNRVGKESTIDIGEKYL